MNCPWCKAEYPEVVEVCTGCGCRLANVCPICQKKGQRHLLSLGERDCAISGMSLNEWLAILRREDLFKEQYGLRFKSWCLVGIFTLMVGLMFIIYALIRIWHLPYSLVLSLIAGVCFTFITNILLGYLRKKLRAKYWVIFQQDQLQSLRSQNPQT